MSSPRCIAVCFIALFFALALVSCGGAVGQVRPTTEPLASLQLDEQVLGDTRDDDGWHLAGCTGGGVAGNHSAVGYRFVAPATGSYRVELHAGYAAVVDVSELDSERRESLICFGVGADGRGAHTVPLREGRAYRVVVDGVMQARGRYRLTVRRDESADAPIRVEDEAVTRPICEAAPTLAVGGEAAGTFASLPGGLRASCGGSGGGVAYRLAVPEGGVRLELAAHFAPILELRRACDGAPVVCAAATDGQFALTLDSPLPAGDYLVLVDTRDVLARPPDDRLGAGVLGAFWLRATAAEVTP